MDSSGYYMTANLVILGCW